MEKRTLEDLFVHWRVQPGEPFLWLRNTAHDWPDGAREIQIFPRPDLLVWYDYGGLTPKEPRDCIQEHKM